jgi:two-component system, NarL family, response regulator DesR
MTITVALVEDQALMLAALAALLGLELDIRVTARHSDPEEALTALKSAPPDVAILDIEMPKMTGLELARRLIAAGLPTKVILVSTFARVGYVEQALKIGVHGYLLKDSPPDRLVQCIRNVHAGMTQIESQLLQQDRAPGERLSERERIMLALVRRGLPNAEIADALNLSHGTVRNAVSEIIAKLGATNRIDACRIAEERGWL